MNKIKLMNIPVNILYINFIEEICLHNLFPNCVKVPYYMTHRT